MSEVKVNKISPRSGTTVTLGDSGDTFTIPSGATINNQGTAVNFGATGSASWVTTVKTSTFTAVAGEGYFVNTTGGVVSVNLPAGVAGAVVAIKDYAGTFDTNAVTLVQNGSDKIGGSTSNTVLETEGLAVTLVFIDSTQGWLVTDSGLQSEAPGPSFITATGGTITTVCTNFKVHTFTGPGTFCVSNAGNALGSNTVDYLVIAGGGSGGTASNSPRAAGAGAGGYRFSNGTASGSYCAGPSPLGASALPVSAQGYPITVGGGGAGQGTDDAAGNSGSNSVFDTITSTSGGGGGAGGGPIPAGNSVLNGKPGGSGGGAGAPGCSGPGATGTIGAGNTPPVSPSQGNSGGLAEHDGGDFAAGGGGGGAGAVGANASPFGTPTPTADAGAGGNGLTSSITASPVTRAGGGGGNFVPGPAAPGGTGGGGAGNSAGAGTAGTTNTGSGGGAGGEGGTSGAGGSGIVVIRYRFQA